MATILDVVVLHTKMGRPILPSFPLGVVLEDSLWLLKPVFDVNLTLCKTTGRLYWSVIIIIIIIIKFFNKRCQTQLTRYKVNT